MRSTIIAALLPLATATLPVFAQSSTITINSGSTLLISGGDHSFNCSDITVKGGGSLEITAGKLSGLNFRVEPGGSFSKTGGTVIECDQFYIIKTKNGVVVVPI